MGISSSAVLVELNISVWTANKVDKDATSRVTTDANAVADAGQFKKNLMAGTHQRKAIADFAAGCRLWHNVRTMPWADKGGRLLPTSLFLDYKQEANTRRNHFDTMVSEFCINYPALVQTANNYLGSLFNPEDYPSVDEVRSKFGFRLVFSPVPEAGDFRLDVGSTELEELKSQYEASADERVQRAMQEQWDKLHTMLGGMSAKLTEPEEETVTIKRWHDTFITNAQDLCAMLTHLNITNDPNLEKARRELESALFSTDIDDLKENEFSRKELKERVDSMLKTYEW